MLVVDSLIKEFRGPLEAESGVTRSEVHDNGRGGYYVSVEYTLRAIAPIKFPTIVDIANSANPSELVVRSIESEMKKHAKTFRLAVESAAHAWQKALEDACLQ